MSRMSFRSHKTNPYQVRRHAGGKLLLRGQLLVRRRRGVYHERLRIAHVCQVARELQPVHDLAPNLRVAAALDAKAEHAAERVLPQQPARERVRRVRLQAEVAHPRDLLVLLEPPRERQRIIAVPLPAQAERLEALQEQERAERVHARAEVAQDLHAQLDGERERAKGLREDEPVVPLGRLGERREFAGARPIELARVDDDASDGRAVPADPLGGAVD
jgi:hypothetical protein